MEEGGECKYRVNSHSAKQLFLALELNHAIAMCGARSPCWGGSVQITQERLAKHYQTIAICFST